MDFLNLVTLLPVTWQPYVQVAIGVIATASVVSASLKPLVQYLPKAAQVWALNVLHAVDWLAVNTKRAKSMKADLAASEPAK